MLCRESFAQYIGSMNEVKIPSHKELLCEGVFNLFIYCVECRTRFAIHALTQHIKPAVAAHSAETVVDMRKTDHISGMAIIPKLHTPKKIPKSRICSLVAVPFRNTVHPKIGAAKNGCST